MNGWVLFLGCFFFLSIFEFSAMFEFLGMSRNHLSKEEQRDTGNRFAKMICMVKSFKRMFNAMRI